MKIDYKKLIEHAILIGAAAILSDLLAHVPVVDGGTAALVVVVLRYALDVLKGVTAQ